MSRAILFVTLLFIHIVNADASKRPDRDEDYDNAFFAVIDQAVAAHEASKRPRSEEELNADDFDQIDALIATHTQNTRTPAAVQPETPPVVEQRRFLQSNSTPTSPFSRRKLFSNVSISELVNTQNIQELILSGTRMKFIANVYRGNVNEKANIFLPRFTITHESSDGTLVNTSDYFRTERGQMVFFASGGTSHRWEKTVSRVFQAFYGEQVKLIRAHAIEKHLKKMGINTFKASEYEDRETELHSEKYFDLFFRHFFLPKLQANYKNIHSLTIDAYSWWEVCDTCEGYFPELTTIARYAGIPNVVYNIYASQSYAHEYENDALNQIIISKNQDQQVWQEIWSKVQALVDQDRQDPQERKRFWTKTAKGLELTKWLGQAFVENRFMPDGRYAQPEDRGDLLQFFTQLTHEATTKKKAGKIVKKFQDFILYLSEVNWDLSCWYRLPCFSQAQMNWKKYHNQRVEPHFDWVLVDSYRDENASTVCQMCGKKGIVEASLVYHRKYNISAKGLNLSRELSQDNQTMRTQSIIVGSDCLESLERNEEEIKEWRNSHPLILSEEKAIDNANTKAAYDKLDRVAADELYKAIQTGCAENGGKVTTRYLAKLTTYESAKDMEPALKILLTEQKIIKSGRGEYKLFNAA